MISFRDCRCTQNFVFSIAAFRRLLHSSTAAAPNALGGQNHFMVDYLIKSLGFSRNDAISASSKVTRLKSAQKPDLVIDLFRRYGFDNALIKSLVHSRPKVILCKPDKTLEPKLRLLRELGLSGPDLAEFLKKHPCVFFRGLDTHIIPLVTHLKEFLGRDEDVLKALNRSCWLLSGGFNLKNLMNNVRVLRGCGLLDDRIRKFLIQFPREFILKPELLEDAVRRVDEELHIPRDSGMFLYGVQALCYITKPKLEIKFRIFRSFGWSDSDIYNVARAQPHIFTMSDARLTKMLSFYMKEMCYTSTCLATCPAVVMMSLERRVRPRVQVLKILKEKELLDSKFSLSPLMISGSKFEEKFILRYKNEIPNLFEHYTKISKQ